MGAIDGLTALPGTKQLGNQIVFFIPIKIEVAAGSFLHVGGTPSPLTEKKQPVFSVDGQPIIPASSFKGAFRHQVEALFIQKKNALAASLGVSQANLLKPSIPAPRPSKAEQDLFGIGYRREHSEIKVEEDKVQIPENGLCPVSYFFGAQDWRVTCEFPTFSQWRVNGVLIRLGFALIANCRQMRQML